MLHGDISSRLTPGTVTDAGSVTGAAASPLVGSESATATESGSVTAATARPLAATESGTATASGSVTTATATPLTASDSVVASSTETIVESFEDDLTNYTGDTANYSRVLDAAFAQHGDYYLSQDDAAFNAIHDQTTRAHYPKQGDRWRVWFYTRNGGGSNNYAAMYFADQSSTAQYWVRLHVTNDSFDLDMEAAGTTSTAVTLAKDTWYEVMVEWDDGATFGGAAGDCTATLFDASGTQLATVSNSDTGNVDGGIGWFGADPVDFDYARITNR